LIKALAVKCHALIIASDSNSTLTDPIATAGSTTVTGTITTADLFQSTYKELCKWEDLEKSDTNWELVVYKNNQANRSFHTLPLNYIHCYTV
jgi:hypothetical protein